MNFRTYRVGLIAFLCLCLCTSLSAQEDAPESTPSEPSEKPAAAGFADVFGQWKDLLRKLRGIKNEFDDAENDALPALREQFQQTLAEGEQLIPLLCDAAEKAYGESPNENREITRLLLRIADDKLMLEDYDTGARILLLLADNGCDEKTLIDRAGVAAFKSNQFDAAKKYLNQAREDGSASSEGETLLLELDDYTKHWDAEQELRQSEAEGDDLPRVKLETTKGSMVIELFENEAPQTVGNFVHLVEQGFYNGLKFHRVLSGFMAQAGCPKGDGTGDAGYKIYCECHKPEHRKHFRGSLSMAKAPDRDTGGSQFFITFVPTSHLNGKHTVFGRVIEGMEVLNRLHRVQPGQGLPGADDEQTDSIVSAEVLRKRDHEYAPTKVE